MAYEFQKPPCVSSAYKGFCNPYAIFVPNLGKQIIVTYYLLLLLCLGDQMVFSLAGIDFEIPFTPLLILFLASIFFFASSFSLSSLSLLLFSSP